MQAPEAWRSNSALEEGGEEAAIEWAQLNGAPN